SEGFGLTLKHGLLVLGPLLIIEQISIYLTGHVQGVIPLLIGLTVFQIVMAIVTNKKRSKKNASSAEQRCGVNRF
ncbi:hypothetical protein, partial [Lactobacillus amylolyticus]|uniref:hypothetical protein n=1 Tax=Lactobacillus amylolyticus TaxID=83683 RepID=UPI0024906790